MSLRLGISTCPNDTFAFHGLLEGRHRGSLDLTIELLDIQELNERLAAGSLDAGKVSFAAALGLMHRHVILPVGSALGFGVGPLLLASSPGATLTDAVCLCPGSLTTATLLLRCLHPEVTRIVQRNFAAIMPELQAGEAGLGVVIHEGRFTYASHGLHLVEDLGERWEKETGMPVPLGGLIARRSLGPRVLQELSGAISASLHESLSRPDSALPTMRHHAQELSDAVIEAHVHLYVNQHTVDLGREGRAAVRVLYDRALAAGALHQNSSAPEFFPGGVG